MKAKSIFKPLLVAIMFVLCSICAVLGITSINASAAETTAVTFTHNKYGVQDWEGSLYRYLITINTDQDIPSMKVPATLEKNGEYVKDINVELSSVDATTKYFIVYINDLVGEKVSTSKIADTYKVTVKANTAIGSAYHLASDYGYVISGGSVAESSTLSEITMTNVSAVVNPAFNRYLVTLKLDAAQNFAGHLSVGMWVSKNGGEPERKNFDLYRSDDTTRLILITYSVLTGDSSITEASQIKDYYEVTLKKGTLINKYLVAEDITYAMHGGQIMYLPNNPTEEITLGVAGINGAQDDCVRYGVTISTSADLGGHSVIPAIVDNKPMLFEVYYFGADSALIIMSYDKLEAGKTTGAEMGQHRIIIPEGAPIAGKEMTKTLVFDTNGVEIVEIDPETLIERAVTLTVGDNGTATAPEVAFYTKDVEITVTPNEGYEVDAITVNEEAQDLSTLADGKFTFVCPKADVAINVTFKKIAANVSCTTDGVVVAPVTEGNLFYGDEYSFTVSAAEGYKLGETVVVKVNDVEVTANEGTYTVTLTAANVITVEGVEVITYTVTFMNGEEVVDTKTVNYGGKVATIEAPAKEGYNFVAWNLGESAYDFEAVVTADITLTAVYEEIPETPDEPTTSTPDTDAPTTSTPDAATPAEKDEGGCSSSIMDGSFVVLFAMLAVATVVVACRRKEN